MMASTKDAPGTALAVPDKAQLAAIYAALNDDVPLPTPSDPEIMSKMIMERILTAETFEEAARPQTLTAWRDRFLDRAVYVTDVHFNNSTVGGGGAAIYAVCDVRDAETGETATVTCGGRNVLAFLVRALEKGWLSNAVRMVGKQTAEGYTALWIEDAQLEAPF